MYTFESNFSFETDNCYKQERDRFLDNAQNLDDTRFFCLCQNIIKYTYMDHMCMRPDYNWKNKMCKQESKQRGNKFIYEKAFTVEVRDNLVIED